MERPEFMIFRRKFADTSSNIAAKLRQHIERDVDGTSFRSFHYYSVCLPALDLFPEAFKQQYIISVCDLDMKNDLKTSKVINWCSVVKNLYPISTTGDGNCMLHAVSLALWGIEDSEQFLRRLLYATLSNGDMHRIKQRWKYSQDELVRQHPQEFNYDVTSLELSVEWENVVKAASDIVEGRGSTRPFPTLEGVHLFGLAHLLKRPIVVLAEKTARSVYGNSVQENNLYGIYLPLDVKHDICKTPVILGYSLNHFAPLVTQANSPEGDGSSQSILPLVMSDMSNLPVRFLLKEEEYRAGQLMKQYMFVKNIPQVLPDAITCIPGVVLEHQYVHDELDIVSAHRRECEQIFLNVGFPVIQAPAGGVKVNVGETFTGPSPAHITGPTPVGPAPPGHIPTYSTPMEVTQLTGRVPQFCKQRGCQMYGSPTTADMCFTCFCKYTEEFGRREAEQKGRQLPNEPSAPPMTFSEQQSYRDLSVMGEKCCNPNCANRCSVNTYPYCHECEPHAAGTGTTAPGVGTSGRPASHTPGVATSSPVARTSGLAGPPGVDILGPLHRDISMMDVKCMNPKCDNQCSSHTHPFCHECRDFFIPPAGPHYFTQSGPVPPNTQMHGFSGGLPQNTQMHGLSGGLPQGYNVAQPQIPNTTEHHAPRTTPPHAGRTPERREDVSWMEYQCANTIRCANFCSKNTYPYCHECHDKMQVTNTSVPIETSTPNQTPQAACGPPNFSTEDIFQAGIVSDLRRELTTSQNQEQGPEDDNLLGKGTSAPLNAEVGKLDIATGGTTAGVEPAEEMVHSLSSHFSFGPSSQTHVIQSTSAGTQSPQLGLVSFPEQSGSQKVSEQMESSYAVIGEGTHSEHSENNPNQGQGHMPESPEPLKQLCSKAGCRGVRISNNYGYCFDCWNRCMKGGEDPGIAARILDSGTSTEESRMLLNTSEIKELNPIVISSKDKQDCASPLCDKKIYPPAKLCERCIGVLRQGQSRSMEEPESPRHQRKVKSYSPTRPKCKNENCTFSGSSKTNGYCSQCFKKAIETQFEQRPTLSNIPHDPVKHTKSAPVLKGAARNCMEHGCDKFGDPNMYDRCTEHYSISRTSRTQPGGTSEAFHPQPPPSNRYRTQWEVMQYNIGEKQLPHSYMYTAGQLPAGVSPPSGGYNMNNMRTTAPSEGLNNLGNVSRPLQGHFTPAVQLPGGQYRNNLGNPPRPQATGSHPTHPAYTPSQQGNFTSTMATVENNVRNSVHCKTSGCPNYGSGTRQGYCSECYINTLRRRGIEQLPADDPDMNYGCC